MASPGSLERRTISDRRHLHVTLWPWAHPRWTPVRARGFPPLRCLATNGPLFASRHRRLGEAKRRCKCLTKRMTWTVKPQAQATVVAILIRLDLVLESPGELRQNYHTRLTCSMKRSPGMAE